jgi:hypothetical protein
LHGALDGLDNWQDLLAERRQAEASRASRDERGPEAPLERRDTATDRRVLDAKGTSRAGKRPRARKK